MADQSKVESIIIIKIFGSKIFSEFITQDWIVLTTSQPAIIAQSASKIAAIKSAFLRVRAFAQTAGHMLFAISFAQIFISK